jgi:hypothetical protein
LALWNSADLTNLPVKEFVTVIEPPRLQASVIQVAPQLTLKVAAASSIALTHPPT